MSQRKGHAIDNGCSTRGHRQGRVKECKRDDRQNMYHSPFAAARELSHNQGQESNPQTTKRLPCAFPEEWDEPAPWKGIQVK